MHSTQANAKSFSKFSAGFGIALLLIPYLDRNPSRRPADRKLILWLFTLFVVANIVLIVVGTFFRGPGWAFVPPWVHVTRGVE